MLFNDVLLRTRMALSLDTLYSDSTLLVLNKTLKIKPFWLSTGSIADDVLRTRREIFYNDSPNLVLNRTLKSVIELLAVNSSRSKNEWYKFDFPRDRTNWGGGGETDLFVLFKHG